MQKEKFFEKKILNVAPGNVEFSFDNPPEVLLPKLQEEFTQNKKKLRKYLKNLSSLIVPLNMLNVLRTMVKLYGQNFDISLLKLGEKAATSAKKTSQIFLPET